jgi:hypothetical protein
MIDYLATEYLLSGTLKRVLDTRFETLAEGNLRLILSNVVGRRAGSNIAEQFVKEYDIFKKGGAKPWYRCKCQNH